MSPKGRERVQTDIIMIRLSKNLKQALQDLADADRRPLSEFCRFVLEDRAAIKTAAGSVKSKPKRK